MKNPQKIANSNAETLITNMSFVVLWKEHKVDRWTNQTADKLGKNLRI